MVPDSDTRGPLFQLPQVTRLRAGPSSCSTDFWGTSHSELACGTWFHALLPDLFYRMPCGTLPFRACVVLSSASRTRMSLFPGSIHPRADGTGPRG